MTPETEERLIGSIEAGRLMLVCGAGLSMAQPSALPSAVAVSEACFDKYALSVPGLDAGLRGNLEALAEHFAGMKTLVPVFIRTLVPWDRFNKPTNAGHRAVADFLLTGASPAALSSNYDTLIEDSARRMGADFRASLDGDEARVHRTQYAPLLKVHGCMMLDRDETVWVKSQLGAGKIKARIDNSTVWMASELREKDILVVGFWSDWDYLNTILTAAMTDVSPLSVTVVAPTDEATLQAKAPELWALAHAEHVTFELVSEDGAQFLDDLRRAYSRGFLRKVVAAGQPNFQEVTGQPFNLDQCDCPDFDSDTLYRLRCDAEGIPPGKPAKQKSPILSAPLGLFHLQLRQAGAAVTDTGYTLGNRTIRVVNGANKFLTSMAAEFHDAPSVAVAELTVAIGAEDLPLPANVVREGTPGDIMRPGARGRWLNYAGAMQELGL